PVILKRSCHHIITVNSKALELAGITANTPDPEAGTIDRDEHGEPTGVLRETAANLIDNVVPDMTDDGIYEALLTGANLFRSQGVTSVADAGFVDNAAGM